MDPAKFRLLLERSSGEREIAAYLKAHPWIVYWTFCPSSGHDRYLLTEFPLGSQFCADMVILNAYSGVWETLFIELEPIYDRTFTKTGTPSKRLALAARLVGDWRAYMEQHLDAVRQDLVIWAKKRDRLHYSSREEPCNYTRDFLADPGTYIHLKYTILIGRSSLLNREDRVRKGRYLSTGGKCYAASQRRRVPIGSQWRHVVSERLDR